MFRLGILLMCLKIALGNNEQFKGCYIMKLGSIGYQITAIQECIDKCRERYHRYAFLNYNNLCTCENYLGQEYNSSNYCNEVCPYCDMKTKLTDVYLTGNLLPGPPQDVQIINITDRSVHISWKQPISFIEINGYKIQAIVNHTYAKYIPSSPVWSYTNDTFSTKIILLPATKYKISVNAISPDGEGAIHSEYIETLIGEPESAPEPPKILKKHGNKIEIKINEVFNGNGPVSSYLIIVIDEHDQPFFQENLLKSYDEAKNEGINYYITAELKPEMIERNFIVGDGRNYNGYYNAPLSASVSYKFITGIVSRLHGQTKRVFSSLDDISEEKTEKTDSDSPVIIIILSIAIGLFSIILIVGIIGFVIIKNRVTNRRQRLSENQELTLQGPMIEIENSGYLPEEELVTKESHYKNLKQKLRSIPYNQLKVEPTNLLGVGKFGRINSGSVYDNSTLVPIAAYNIPDKKLSAEDKKNMLKDLDILIKTGKHDNLISLIGTCETAQNIYVVLEYVSMNLKDLLLGSRNSFQGKFCNITESQILNIAVDITKGMTHLELHKIVHKQLCTRNILISNGTVPKISSYGLAQYYNYNNIPDYTRWTALEVFKGQTPNSSTDVWSFGCLLWEIFVLGGTPYGSYRNSEIFEKISKGLRLSQMQYFSDELYQLMLDCWQLDPDERPTFELLKNALENFEENTLIPSISFNLYSTFQYEQFYPDLETAVRPVL